MKLSGNKLAGGNPENERVENDFYATNPKAVEMLLKEYKFNGTSFLEPCVGNGNIINVVKDKCKNFNTYYAVDLINRGYEDTITMDFLEWSKHFKENKSKVDTIITNPPFSLATEFINSGMNILSEHGQMAMFLKIQFLECAVRKDLFDKYPPKYVYVFRNRMDIWANGLHYNPKTGKKWMNTICYAWYIWEKGSVTEPAVRWL